MNVSKVLSKGIPFFQCVEVHGSYLLTVMHCSSSVYSSTLGIACIAKDGATRTIGTLHDTDIRSERKKPLMVPGPTMVPCEAIWLFGLPWARSSSGVAAVGSIGSFHRLIVLWATCWRWQPNGNMSGVLRPWCDLREVMHCFL